MRNSCGYLGIGGYRHCLWGGDEKEVVYQVVGGGIDYRFGLHHCFLFPLDAGNVI